MVHEAYISLTRSDFLLIRKALYDVISSNQLMFEVRNQLMSDNYKNKLKEEIRESKKIIEELERIFEG